ncbi:MAG: transglutaminase-like cysteine peptidase [Campylobacterota bacterium]|nr:transglutaminase-like cysteine peptidase [Campylobacterota bacterium]
MKKIIYISILITFLLPSHLLGALVTKTLVKDAQAKHGDFAKKRFLSLYKDLLVKLKNKSEMEKLTAVNEWYNYIQYRSDIKVYGITDHWAALYEFVGRGMGDCEDYTIAKYCTLKALGVSPKKMKFGYVVYKSRSGKNISHMILAYLTKAKPKSKKDILILDNINKKILPASKRKDIIKLVKLMNGDTGAASKKWKQMQLDMKRKKL